jgi:hypothetical protein
MTRIRSCRPTLLRSSLQTVNLPKSDGSSPAGGLARFGTFALGERDLAEIPPSLFFGRLCWRARHSPQKRYGRIGGST